VPFTAGVSSPIPAWDVREKMSSALGLAIIGARALHRIMGQRLTRGSSECLQSGDEDVSDGIPKLAWGPMTRLVSGRAGKLHGVLGVLTGVQGVLICPAPPLWAGTACWPGVPGGGWNLR
jgi:hypothetical protein